MGNCKLVKHTFGDTNVITAEYLNSVVSFLENVISASFEKKSYFPKPQDSLSLSKCYALLFAFVSTSKMFVLYQRGELI